MNPRRLAVSKVAAIAVVTALAATACGGSDDSTADTTNDTTVEVPDGATLCGVYTDEYKVIVDSPTPFGEDGWRTRPRSCCASPGCSNSSRRLIRRPTCLPTSATSRRSPTRVGERVHRGQQRVQPVPRRDLPHLSPGSVAQMRS